MTNDIPILLANIADGDMDALGKLYDLLANRVFNYSRTVTRSGVLAEDVTHDVFLQIHKNAARIVKMEKPTAYIMVITRNRSYDALRSGGDTVPLDETLKGSPQEEQLYLEDAFARLPVVQREAAYLHLVCGYTHKEVAKIQNAPLVTVKWRYGKALAQLKDYFTETEEQCHEPL